MKKNFYLSVFFICLFRYYRRTNRKCTHIFFFFLGLLKGDCKPFIVDGQQVGLIRPDVLKQLSQHPDVFCVRSVDLNGAIELNPAFRDYTERSEHVDKVLRQFKSDGTFVTLKGWREEVNDCD